VREQIEQLRHAVNHCCTDETLLHHRDAPAAFISEYGADDAQHAERHQCAYSGLFADQIVGPRLDRIERSPKIFP